MRPCAAPTPHRFRRVFARMPRGLRASCRSDGLARRVARGPGPLEVEAAEPAGHVHGLADEVEAGHAAAAERLRGQLARVDVADRDLCLAVALARARLHPPGAQALAQHGELSLARLAQRTRRPV